MRSFTVHWVRSSALAVFALVAAVVLLLSGCAGAGSTRGEATASADLLARHGLAGLDARQIIDRLDATPVAERPADLMASVRPGELVLISADKRQIALPMPADETYVSVAPYVSQTHECHFHSLTTCRGEMAGASVHVTVTDAATGQTLVDEARTAFDNGFVGLWLPRGRELTLRVAADGRSAQAPVSTADPEAATCITTLELT